MRFSNIICLLIIAAAAYTLYSVKYSVQAMDAEIAVLKAQIAEEKENVHVLSAEWTFLTRPERLSELAARYLEAQPVHGHQLAELHDVPFSDENIVQMASDNGAYDPPGKALEPAPSVRPGIIAAGGARYVR